MLTRVFSVVCVLAVFCGRSNAVTQTSLKTSDFEEISMIFSRLDMKNTIAVFDCDDVLYRIRDKLMSKGNEKQRGEFLSALKSSPRCDFAKVSSEIFLESDKCMVDERMSNLVRDVQDKGGKALVLTQCGTGSLGNIPSMEQWRIDVLAKFGYDFSRSWNGLPKKFFDEFTTEGKRFFPTSSSTPVWDSGVLFACNAKKGDLFSAFIAWCQVVNPHCMNCSISDLTVVFIDDSIDNVNDMNEACAKLGVKEVIGICYTASEDFSVGHKAKKKRKFCDQQSEQCDFTTLQRKILEEHNVWLNDGNAMYTVQLVSPLKCTQSLADSPVSRMLFSPPPIVILPQSPVQTDTNSYLQVSPVNKMSVSQQSAPVSAPSPVLTDAGGYLPVSQVSRILFSPPLAPTQSPSSGVFIN